MLQTKEILKSKGLKATPQRIVVYKAMKELGHSTAEELIDHTFKQFPMMTVATVYNILDSFVNVGLLEKLPSSGNKMHFDINTSTHCHLYCEKNESFCDYPDPHLMEMISEYLAQKSIEGFKVTGIDLNIKGEFINK